MGMVRLGYSAVLVFLVVACGKTEDTRSEAGGGGSAGAGPPSTAGTGASAGTAGGGNVPEALETFYGEEVTASQPYSAGLDLVVDHIKGEIVLVPGESGVVSASFRPFTIRGTGAEMQAAADLLTGWSGEVLAESNQITVISQQLGDWDEVGALLTMPSL